jgi:putative ABC transport system substrate-binding protein
MTGPHSPTRPGRQALVAAGGGHPGKWVTLLREAVPKVSGVAVLAVSQTPAHHTYWKEIQGVARALKMTPQRLEVAGPDEIENAFSRLGLGRVQGLIVLPHAITSTRRAEIARLAAKHRLAGMYPDRQYVEGDGLMSYAANFSDLHRRTAAIVDKILKRRYQQTFQSSTPPSSSSSSISRPRRRLA